MAHRGDQMTTRRLLSRALFERPIEFWAARVLAAGFLAIGAGLVFQAHRFSSTPAYGNLIILLDAPTWGWMYITSALLLLAWVTAAPRSKWWAGAAHLPAIMLTWVWLIAFVIRYLTDSSTTVVNVVSWSMFFVGLVRSLVLAVRSGGQ